MTKSGQVAQDERKKQLPKDLLGPMVDARVFFIPQDLSGRLEGRLRNWRIF